MTIALPLSIMQPCLIPGVRIMDHILINVIEGFFAVALFINAMLFIPQAWRIHKTRTAAGVSLITFGGFFITQLLTIAHAFIAHDMILLVGYILALATCGSVILLAIKYRKPQ